ncbi:MAG: L-erythro-3,5-diaminohexanoate dehydrogenase [Myxococcaceae bacterium]
MLDMYGLSRVIGEKPGTLPQRAERLDPSLPLRSGEVLIDVERLNVDSASFRQLEREVGCDAARVSEAISRLVRTRGKLHNPVTGSGGMLIGRVREVHADHPQAKSLQPGTRIATLVSLTLTPLQLDEIRQVDLQTEQVSVRGHAILFASGLFAVLPNDIPERLALGVLDVCGAPALTARLAQPGMNVLVIGAGKSGALCLAQARRSLKGKGKLIALDVSAAALEALENARLCDASVKMDATLGVDVMHAVSKATDGKMADLVINCASVAQTEMASILSVRSGGTLLFFSMATSFTAAALGAEGVGKDVTLLIGNGYVPGHAELALDLLRGEPQLRVLFETRYA